MANARSVDVVVWPVGSTWCKSRHGRGGKLGWAVGDMPKGCTCFDSRLCLELTKAFGPRYPSHVAGNCGKACSCVDKAPREPDIPNVEESVGVNPLARLGGLFAAFSAPWSNVCRPCTWLTRGKLGTEFLCLGLCSLLSPSRASLSSLHIRGWRVLRLPIRHAQSGHQPHFRRFFYPAVRQDAFLVCLYEKQTFSFQ